MIPTEDVGSELSDAQLCRLSTHLLRLLKLIRIKHRNQFQIGHSKRNLVDSNQENSKSSYSNILTGYRRDQPTSSNGHKGCTTSTAMILALGRVMEQTGALFKILKREQFSRDLTSAAKFRLCPLSVDLLDSHSELTTSFQFNNMLFLDAEVPKHLVWLAVFDKLKEKFQRVTRLAFKKCSLSEESLLSLFQRITTLEDLKIHGEHLATNYTKVTAESLMWLCSSNPNLKELSLDECKIGDEAANIIVSGLKLLTDLYLRGNRLTDKSVICIARDLHYLQKLGLKRNIIVDGYEAIARHQLNLELLYLTISNVNHRGVIAIAASLKHLKVLQVHTDGLAMIALCDQSRPFALQLRHLCPNISFAIK